MRGSRLIYLSIILSLFFHFSGWLGLWYGSPLLSRSEKIQPIDITYKDLQTTPNEQPVRDTKSPYEIEDREVDYRFLSKRRKTVSKQMRAPKVGLTANRSPSPSLTPVPDLSGASSNNSSKNHTQSPNVVPKVKSSSATSGSRPLSLPDGISTIGERLPEEIPVGLLTSLNTDRHLYYTFYMRTEERLRFHWERNVRAALDRLNPRVVLRQDEWITVLEIILNSRGDFVRANVLRSSGIEYFDQAAIEGFKLGSPYINPPQEMVQDDGRIHLKYSFSVQVNPSAYQRLSRPSSSGRQDRARF